MAFCEQRAATRAQNVSDRPKITPGWLGNYKHQQTLTRSPRSADRAIGDINRA
jgi:hypothetical protein